MSYKKYSLDLSGKEWLTTMKKNLRGTKIVNIFKYLGDCHEEE